MGKNHLNSWHRSSLVPRPLRGEGPGDEASTEGPGNEASTEGPGNEASTEGPGNEASTGHDFAEYHNQERFPSCTFNQGVQDGQKSVYFFFELHTFTNFLFMF